jgi:hypothetical protein
MKNLLKEEINDIKYLFGYKKGVVISEQDELGSAPKQLFTYINGQKELNTAFLGDNGELGKWVGPEVKKWCTDNATGDTVCVLGKSIKKDQVQNLKLPAAIGMAKADYYTVEKVSPTYIGEFEEDSGDGTKQIKHYYGAVYSKS